MTAATEPEQQAAVDDRWQPRARPRRSPWAAAALAVTALAVVAVHFRPWQGGLLEEWSLSLDWEAHGLHGYVLNLPLTLGRPLHLLPYYLGMALSDGGTVGPYVVLTLVALAQLLGAWWALAPVVRSSVLRLVLSAAIALHPWWAAGDILRFLPAQVSTLATVLWLGFAVRLLERPGRWLTSVAVFVVPLIGLLGYQAPSAALGTAALVMAVTWVAASRRRRVVLLVATVASVVTALAWAILIAPRLSDSSYEGQLAAAGLDVGLSVRAIARTVVRSAPELLVLGALVAALVVTLILRRHVPTGHGLLLLAAIGASPLAAMIYAGQPAHLNDPERVALPVGLTLWLIACLAARGVPEGARWPTVAGALAGVLVVVGAVTGYSTWTSYAVAQQQLIEAVAPVRADLGPEERLVVADTTGAYGDVYTLLPPHLNMAVDVELGAGADVELCTPAATPREHPIAARYPISTTPVCEELLAGLVTEPAGTATTDEGTVQLLVIP